MLQLFTKLISESFGEDKKQIVGGLLTAGFLLYGTMEVMKDPVEKIALQPPPETIIEKKTAPRVVAPGTKPAAPTTNVVHRGIASVGGSDRNYIPQQDYSSDDNGSTGSSSQNSVNKSVFTGVANYVRSKANAVLQQGSVKTASNRSSSENNNSSSPNTSPVSQADNVAGAPPPSASPSTGGSGSTVAPSVVSPSPTISSVSPAVGPSAGGTSVIIYGTNFATGATVTIGGVACSSVTVVSATQITCTTGSRAAASVEVIVLNPDSQTYTKTAGFTYYANPSASFLVAVGSVQSGSYARQSSTGLTSGHETFIKQVP